MICTRCINSAHIAYKFQQQCNTSQTILESYLEQIKINTLDSKSIAISKNLPENTVGNIKVDTGKIKSNNEIQYSSSPDTDLILDSEELLAEGLEYIANDCLMNEEQKDADQRLLVDTEIKDSEDCDDLKNCIPLGEDTVDQLIDDFKVENLELISPKMDFNLNIRTPGKSLIPPPDPPRILARVKKCPSMDYYKRNEEGTVVSTY